jgi:outer membrane protein TolC
MKNSILSLAIIVTSTTLNAQKLDLTTCLKMADTANLTIRNAQLDVAITKKQRDGYLTARYPHLYYGGDYKYNALIPGQVVPAAIVGGPPGTYTTVQFGVPYIISNNFQINQLLFNPQVEYGLTALKINNEIVLLQQKMTEQSVKHQVASTYYNLQALNKQVSFVESNRTNMLKLISNMDAMVKQEMMIQTEVDKLMINKLTLDNTIESLNATKYQLETLLKILIGMDTKTPISIDADDMIEKTILIDKSSVNYIELDLIAAQQRMNKAERRGTNMGYLPNISFYGSYSYMYNVKPEDNYRKGINGAAVGLKVDWTLFDGLEKYHKQKENALNAEKLSNQLEQSQQQLSLVSELAKKQISVQSNALEVAKEQLKLAEKVYNQTTLQFNQGTISSNDLITADNALQQQQTNLVAAYIKLRQAELDYLKSIGKIN